jgi:type I restriction enzyme, S subunit
MSVRTLGALVKEHGGLIQTGPFGSQLHQHDYSEDGIPVVMPKDIKHGRIDESTIARIPERKARELSRHALKAGSVVFPRRGDISKCGYIDESQAGFLCGTGCIKIEPPEDKLRSRFLFYYLGLRQCVEWLERNAVGTTMLNLNTKILGGLQIPPISPGRQDRIVAILSAYDNLIENNRRRIQLMEQAARLLYKEWFVQLRFPGHEHTRIVDGVPEGWEKKTLEDLAESVSYGLTASSTSDAVGPRFLRITDIVPPAIDWRTVPYCRAPDKKIARNRLQIGDVVVARTGATVGYAKRLTWLPGETVYASYLVRFRFSSPANDLIAGLFMESNSYKEFVRNHAGGAAQPNANAKVLGSASLLIPSVDLQKHFSDAISAVFQQRDALAQLSSRLTQARDLLLPRLMNGEVVV